MSPLLHSPFSFTAFRVSTIYLLTTTTIVGPSHCLQIIPQQQQRPHYQKPTVPMFLSSFSSSSSSSPSSSSTTGDTIRIVNYNVLSSHLASPDHFTQCKPEHLEQSNRLPKLLQKLNNEMENEKNIPVIFCLQEVSHCWAGKLHAYFANKNYHFITALYGKRFNNYMGIAIAIPMDTLEIVDVDISRLSDYREGGWPRKDEDEENRSSNLISSTIQYSWNTVYKSSLSFFHFFLVRPMRTVLQLAPPSRPPPDHWKISEHRYNQLLFCRLRWKIPSTTTKSSSSSDISQKTFCISNYHMPCAFWAPMVMNIHAELAVKHSQNLALQDPLILAGDFNFMPDSPTYQLITTGDLSKDDSTYPTPKYGVEWKSTIQPMRSAYAISENKEPCFTNYAQVKEEEPFIGTLDYIFLSNHWKLNNVLTTVKRKEANGPFPNEIEPSDHIMIWSDLKL